MFGYVIICMNVLTTQSLVVTLVSVIIINSYIIINIFEKIKSLFHLRSMNEVIGLLILAFRFFYCCAGWEYIIAFTKVLAMYQIHHI
jgi:hypothetical protein